MANLVLFSDRRPAGRRLRRYLPLTLLATLLVAAAPAAAARPATHREAAAIRPAVRIFVDSIGSPAPRTAHITTITISTADDSYGLVGLTSRRSGSSKVMVHLVGRRWHVIGFAVGAFSCSLAPAAVFRDLLGSADACTPDGY